MHNAARLRRLITEYGQLSSLSGAQTTPQARGIRFNELIAEMLGCWGIEAEVSTATPGAGEIDVTFTLDGHRYLIEAKWEQSKTDAGPLAKLEKRLRQRFRGTIGIFLSMTGYTEDALHGIDKGSQLETLLFDRSHLEAMLSGLIPPQELLKLAHDRASFRGHAYSNLLELLSPKHRMPTVSYGAPPELADGLALSIMQGLRARTLLTMAESRQLGVTADETGKLLITHEDGIAEVDLAKQRAKWKVPVRGCHGTPLPREDGSILFARKHGIACLKNDEMTIVGGALWDSSTMIAAPDGNAWAADPTTGEAPQSSAVTKLGSRLGQQERFAIATTWENAVAVGGAWVNNKRLALIHGNFCSVTKLDGAVARGLATGLSNCTGLLVLDDHTVLVIGGEAELRLTDLTTGRHAEVARLALRPSVFELSAGLDGKLYLASFYGSGPMNFAIIELEMLTPTEDFVSRAFASADSGDLLGYAEQVDRIADRDVPSSPSGASRLNARYNEALRQVSDGLEKPLTQLAERSGLQPSSPNISRRLDGWPPPEYGGAGSQPRWRAQNTYDGPWLEACIGVTHRMWPTANLNDLVIILILAVMSNEQQHTLLTRFVPFTSEEFPSPAAIEELLADIQAVLPKAVEFLTDTHTDSTESSPT